MSNFGLEHDADAELEGAWHARRERTGAKPVAIIPQAGRRAVYRTGRAVQETCQGAAWRIEVGDIEEIEHFNHRLDSQPLIEAEALREADVGVDKRVNSHLVARRQLDRFTVVNGASQRDQLLLCE